jgi:uncharacterized membrane protein YhaH (DUF805 family)
MDWKHLFFSANGRIGQKDFWIGFLILFVAGWVLGMIPLIGIFASLLMIYCWACLYSKRLHDFGKSGWLQLVPFGVMVAAGVVAGVVGGASAITAAMSGQNDPAAAAAMLTGLGGVALIMCLAMLVWLAFLLWVGLSKGTPGDNQYGPAPSAAVPATA